MGHRLTQRIIQCSSCNDIPDDGEYLWEMCGEYMCADCVDKPDCNTELLEDSEHLTTALDCSL